MNERTHTRDDARRDYGVGGYERERAGECDGALNWSREDTGPERAGTRVLSLPMRA